MDKDAIMWELIQWFVPIWCEYVSFKFFITLFTGSLMIFLLTLNVYAVIFWLIGFQIFGFCLAYHEGVFD